MKKEYKHFETAAIHAGYDTKKHLGSLSAPIYQTSTFTFDTAEQGEARFAGTEEGYIYSRLGNPTVQALEEKVAVLEGCLRIWNGSGFSRFNRINKNS